MIGVEFIPLLGYECLIDTLEGRMCSLIAPCEEPSTEVDLSKISII
jgi:hypothetical protein